MKTLLRIVLGVVCALGLSLFVPSRVLGSPNCSNGQPGPQSSSDIIWSSPGDECSTGLCKVGTYDCSWYCTYDGNGNLYPTDIHCYGPNYCNLQGGEPHCCGECNN
jgi:hypothetical protein